MITLLDIIRPVQITTCLDDLAPLEAGVISDDSYHFRNEVVMRTASRDKKEIMIISSAEPGRCWTNSNGIPLINIRPFTSEELQSLRGNTGINQNLGPSASLIDDE